MECPEIKRILFATDDSENAHHAFSYAACFAKKFNAKITLLHVVQEFKDMVVFDFGIERSVAAEKWFSVNNEYFQEIKERFKDLVNKNYHDESINIEDILVEKGNPRSSNRLGREQSSTICESREQSCCPVPNVRSG